MLTLFTSLPARAEALTISIGYLPANYWWIGATLWSAFGIALLILWVQKRRNRDRLERYTPPRVDFVQGDITKAQVDAIVNAAKSSLLGGGGVDGAIHRAAGPALLAECKRLRESILPDGLATGQAISTTGGDLPARNVIHTVGPIYMDQPDPALLRSCYTASLRAADMLHAESVAFPLISSGVYAWPTEDAIRQALFALFTTPTAVKVVKLYLFDHKTYALAKNVQTSMGL